MVRERNHVNPSKKHILWGVTGSVATIRGADLAAALLEIGEVRAVATRRAQHFLPPLPAEIKVFSDEQEWELWKELGDPILHIELRKWADVLVIAPATADCLAKLSGGICDTLLLSIGRAWDFSKPIVLAPAMNTMMWEHPTTREHLDRLQSWGARVVWPVAKKLACQDVGMGALAPGSDIAHDVREALKAS